jgi:tetratricopeptide (TPR) repeat protein
LRALHRLDVAADAFEHALKLNPSEARIAQALGAVYLELERYADAARVYRDALARKELAPPAERATRIQLASALRRAGKHDDATDELRGVLRAEPRSAAALAGLGLVYEAKGRHELAELVLRRALEVQPAGPVAAATWNDLGLVLLSLRRDQEAFAAFDKAAALDPQLAEARQNRAGVYLDCGDYGSAAKELGRLTEAQPGNVSAWVALGVAERGLGRFDEARRAYEHALALDAADPAALYNEGVLLMDWKKDPAAARPFFEKFVRAADHGHPKRADAEARLRELTKGAPAPPAGAKG